jgi:hypothetical protein
MSDAFVLGAESLRPRNRSVQQGPTTIEVEYGDGKVTGTIKAGPQEIPIDEELEAPVFGSDTALNLVITALPLAEGYETTLRTFEVGMQQRTRLWSVEVAGSESVEVPAGTYETYRVALEALDGEGGGQTLWVTRDEPRIVVKTEGKLPPSMGGGQVVTELTGTGPDETGEAADAAPAEE